MGKALHSNIRIDFDPKTISDVYVYKFSEGGVPFYIGLGRGVRWRRHFYISPLRKGENSHKHRKIHKLLKDPEGIIEVSIVAHELDQKSAEKLEMYLIGKYGRLVDGGTLTNMSIGGESGANGRNHTEEHKNKLSIMSRGQNTKATEELVYRAKLLYHYRAMKPKDIVKLPEYSHLTKATISNWISKSNPNYSYVAPHLKCESELWEEKKEEVIKLFETGKWNYTQMANILGLDRCYVSRVCRGLVK